jgi:hypothetical protein
VAVEQATRTALIQFLTQSQALEAVEVVQALVPPTLVVLVVVGITEGLELLEHLVKVMLEATDITVVLSVSLLVAVVVAVQLLLGKIVVVQLAEMVGLVRHLLLLARL